MVIRPAGAFEAFGLSYEYQASIEATLCYEPHLHPALHYYFALMMNYNNTPAGAFETLGLWL